MCKITIDTIRRANKKTMMQISRRKDFSCGKGLHDGFDVSVSLMGTTYAQSLSSAQIRNSFKKAYNSAEKL